MPSPNTIRFFDIASAPPVRPYASNPWKTRYALNFKGVQYQTEWIDLPDVKPTRKAHGVAPVRKMPNGEDIYTSPFVYDATTSTYVGDSFDIALYLDQKYPDSGRRLIPEGSIGLHRAFNAQVDALFAESALLYLHGMPLNPETAEVRRAEFVRRTGVKNWDDLRIEGDARRKMVDELSAALEEFAKIYTNSEGPFLEGKTASYADIIIGAWLMLMKESCPEWEEICVWQGGRWKRLHLALGEWADVK